MHIRVWACMLYRDNVRMVANQGKFGGTKFIINTEGNGFLFHTCAQIVVVQGDEKDDDDCY